MNNTSVVLILVFYLSLVLNLFIWHISKSKGIFLDKGRENKPQKFHKKDTPRAGGIGVALSFFVGTLLACNGIGLKLFISSLPVLFGGIFEDLKGGVKPSVRLFLAFLSAVLAILLTGFRVENLGFVGLPYMVSILFTIFAVAGVTNSINIIDGLNGLASGFSIIALIIFNITLYFLHNYELLKVGVMLAVATFGFFVLNFPKGLIFLGDGGAYFLGFMLAELSVAIVFKYSSISPWFCLAVMIYPVWEVCFSFYRRKILKGAPAMSPDKMHFHSILTRKLTKTNYLSSLVILVSLLPFEVLALLFRSRTSLSMLVIFFFISIYLFVYSTLIWTRIKPRR
ncbi:glycosyltransferase family 4 protein [Hippea alviniae]|uniref:glycosyltransferase family 4 protein n=1 Tax=Hippea alviniae TaxID=1279027 RepID=UPI000414F975|nr:MraY family glycosyltransferase [Hippea alviniae]